MRGGEEKKKSVKYIKRKRHHRETKLGNPQWKGREWPEREEEKVRYVIRKRRKM